LFSIVTGHFLNTPLFHETAAWQLTNSLVLPDIFPAKQTGTAFATFFSAQAKIMCHQIRFASNPKKGVTAMENIHFLLVDDEVDILS
jgi:hypothetical protein